MNESKEKCIRDIVVLLESKLSRYLSNLLSLVSPNIIAVYRTPYEYTIDWFIEHIRVAFEIRFYKRFKLSKDRCNNSVSTCVENMVSRYTRCYIHEYINDANNNTNVHWYLSDSTVHELRKMIVSDLSESLRTSQKLVNYKHWAQQKFANDRKQFKRNMGLSKKSTPRALSISPMDITDRYFMNYNLF